MLIKNLKEISSEKGICGIRKQLLTEKDCNLFTISHLKIHDAIKHYHKKTTEIYYVLKGTGELEVGNETIPLQEGTMVKIDPNNVHRAISHYNLEVLIIMSPPLVETKDQFIVK